MATIMRERLQVSSDVVGQVLNHAPQGVTQRHYAATHSVADMRAALNAWDEYLGGLIGEEQAANVVLCLALNRSCRIELRCQCAKANDFSTDEYSRGTAS